MSSQCDCCVLKGHDTYILWLVKAGANPGQEDFFGMTPLDMALRSGHELCVREMLSVSGQACAVSLWTAQTRAGSLSWKIFSQQIVIEMIIATPNLSRFRESSRIVRQDFFRDPIKYEVLIWVYLLTGNKVEPADTAQVRIFKIFLSIAS